jgi:ATP-dependent DNA helicase PIF1
MTGFNAGQQVLIPRIPMANMESSTLPIVFTRKQFPIRVAFAMSINKAQGQTFQRAGIYLPRPCFSHGQLYVAMSRVGDPSGVRFMIRDGSRLDRQGTFTDNVVYHEIFE